MSVLRSSIAIVIGPTPPGTGVSSPAYVAHGVEVDVAAEALVEAVHADVDDRRAGLHRVGADQPWDADGSYQHVGAGADSRQVARARMADRDRRVALQQQVREWLADEVRAPHDHRLGALERDVVAVEQLDDPERGARPQSGRALQQAAGGDRRQRVDVLVGRDQRAQRRVVEASGQRALEQDPAARGVDVAARSAGR